MANQQPFDEFLTQPLQAPRNPAAEAGMGGPFSGIMHAATNFISGAREARLRNMIETERQQDKNLRAIQTMLEQLDKGGYDPDDEAVHGLRGELVSQLAAQVAGTDDGSKPGKPGGNPLGMFLKQTAVNLLGGPAPKKAPPVTPDKLNEWTARMANLPTLATAQQKARTEWVEAIKEARAQADEQSRATGVPAGPEFYQNHPRLVAAALQMQKYGLKPTDLGGAHPSVIGKAIADRDQANTLANYQEAIKNQRDAAIIEGLMNAPDPGTETFAQFIAQQNPKALRPQGTFVVPMSMQTQERKTYLISPDGKESREILTYPNGIAVDSLTGAPVDIAALQAQKWQAYGTNPRFSPGSQYRQQWIADANNPGTQMLVTVPVLPGETPTQVPGAYRSTVIGTPVVTSDETGRQTIQTWTRPRSNVPTQGNPLAQGQPPQAEPAQAPRPPVVKPQVAPKPAGGATIGSVANPFSTPAASPRVGTTAAATKPVDGIQKKPAVQIPPQVLDQYKLGQLSRKDVVDTYGRDAQYFDNVLKQAAPGFRALTAEQSASINTLSDAIPLLEQFEKLNTIYKTKGPADASAFATHANIASQIETLRGFGGAKGVLTDRDVDRLTKIKPGIVSGIFYPEINEEIIKSIKGTVMARVKQALSGVSEEQKQYILDNRGFSRFLSGGGLGGSRNVNLFQGK